MEGIYFRFTNTLKQGSSTVRGDNRNKSKINNIKQNNDKDQREQEQLGISDW